MDSLIRILKGPGEGTRYTLTAGENVIGRGERASVKLASPDISWEHAVIHRSADDYFIENLSAHGTLVNDTKLTGRVKLRPRDQIRLSPDTLLRFESPSGADGLLGIGRLMWAFIGVLFAIAIVFVFANPFAGSANTGQNWDNAFNTLSAWIDGEIAAHRLPPEADPIFRNAWRLEQSSAYADSQRDWLRFEVLLDQADNKLQAAQRATEDLAAAERDRRHRTVLDRLLSPRPKGEELSNDDKAVATVEFVKRRLRWATLQAPPSRF